MADVPKLPRVNLRLLLGVAPVLIFLGLRGAGCPPMVSVAGGFGASALVFVLTRKEQLVGALALVAFLTVACSAVVGVVTNSEKAYLASGPIGDYLFVTLYAGSAITGQPLIGRLSRELAPRASHRIPQNAQVFVILSLAWAVYCVAQGTARLYMLTSLSTTDYMIWSRILGWPLKAALVSATVWFIYREARKHGPAHNQGAQTWSEQPVTAARVAPRWEERP
jgi:hypothetical protein